MRMPGNGRTFYYNNNRAEVFPQPFQVWSISLMNAYIHFNTSLISTEACMYNTYYFKALFFYNKG